MMRPKNKPVNAVRKIGVLAMGLLISLPGFSWGFYAHKKINYQAVFLLPPPMLLFYKEQIGFISEHAVDPDKRRYALPEEGPRHYIDIDHYGDYPYDSLPRGWKEAVNRFGEDSLQQYGIVPWWLQTLLQRLTNAFREKDQVKILRYSAEIGHYLADAHVPLHACSNHDGQYSGQKGIHGFWESRVPELLAEKEWNLLTGKAVFISNPASFIWERILESARAADTVLYSEKELTQHFPPDQKFAFEEKDGITLRRYSDAFTRAYHLKLNGMVERRMRQSILAVASFWYTAWVNAGQPDLSQLHHKKFSAAELAELEKMNRAWKAGTTTGRDHE